MGNLLSKGIEAEEQRTGRNKETSINHTYIEGGEFRKKFDSISDDKELNKLKAINELQKNFDIIFKEVVAL